MRNRKYDERETVGVVDDGRPDEAGFDETALEEPRASEADEPAIEDFRPLPDIPVPPRY